MDDFRCSLISCWQWQTYQQLELIPGAVPRPVTSALSTLGLNWVWRSLIALLVDELVTTEQQIAYLDRCWAAPDLEQPEASGVRTLKRLWLLMD